ncbi:hypothetical protein RBE51_22390 [Pseudomonas taiwanensis]|uniref:hypothetical protein n=1 Tax=Pseudomonas taiwanensis TaxID=470150 RepID=UPI0028DD5E94|nr:hypothetical protein [Pseudomonas taiwanensis]MDT8925535.1 hypothetical protein [Pseudomonas taiwanensis]
MNNKIDLKSLELLQTDSTWLDRARPEPIFMIDKFHEFLTDMMSTNLGGYYRLSRNHVDSYKKLWGDPAFLFNGKKTYQTWIFNLAEGEHLVLYSANEGGTSFEYAGLPVPSDEAFEKAASILVAIRDTVHKPKDPEAGLGM